MKLLTFLSVVLTCFASTFAQTDSSHLFLNKEFIEIGKQSEKDSSDCSIPGLVFVDEQARFQGGFG